LLVESSFRHNISLACEAIAIKIPPSFFHRNPLQEGHAMSHHDASEHPVIDEKELDSNSRADTLAMFSLVAIVVTMAVFFASR
jgi:hypothetical protein